MRVSYFFFVQFQFAAALSASLRTKKNLRCKKWAQLLTAGRHTKITWRVCNIINQIFTYLVSLLSLLSLVAIMHCFAFMSFVTHTTGLVGCLCTNLTEICAPFRLKWSQVLHVFNQTVSFSIIGDVTACLFAAYDIHITTNNAQ